MVLHMDVMRPEMLSPELYDQGYPVAMRIAAHYAAHNDVGLSTKDCESLAIGALTFESHVHESVQVDIDEAIYLRSVALGRKVPHSVAVVRAMAQAVGDRIERTVHSAALDSPA